jgi:hypothetical protein
MNYAADIHESPNRDGTFVAVLREAAITTTGPDPEHDLCHAMVGARLPDGGIQFWRGTTPSLFYRSVHRTAGYRVKLGESFPYRLVRREEAPSVFAKDRCRERAQNRETPLAGTAGHRTRTGFSEKLSPGQGAAS